MRTIIVVRTAGSRTYGTRDQREALQESFTSEDIIARMASMIREAEEQGGCVRAVFIGVEQPEYEFGVRGRYQREPRWVHSEDPLQGSRIVGGSFEGSVDARPELGGVTVTMDSAEDAERVADLLLETNAD